MKIIFPDMRTLASFQETRYRGAHIWFNGNVINIVLLRFARSYCS